VGVSSQRSIETSVRDALATGKLKGNEKLPAKVTLTLGGIAQSFVVEGDIDLE
jgi:hypothetical protein